MENNKNSRKSLIDKVNDNQTPPDRVKANSTRSNLGKKVQADASNLNIKKVSTANKPLQHRDVNDLKDVQRPSTSDISKKLKSQQTKAIEPSVTKVEANNLASKVKATKDVSDLYEEDKISYDYKPEEIKVKPTDSKIPRKFRNSVVNYLWYIFFGTKVESKPLRIFDYFLRVSFLFFLIGFSTLLALLITSPHQFTAALIYRPDDTLVYDKDAKLMGRIIQRREDGANVENIDYNQLSQGLVNALVATEDQAFFQHHGFDVVSTVNNGINTLVLRRGTGGGSTLTQQLIGETHIGRLGNSSVVRKIREIFLATIAETQLSKETILASYFNYFAFGQGNIRGVELASQFFYDQNAFSNDYVQAAILVGTLNAPCAYNPLGGICNGVATNFSQERLDNVLVSNYNQGYIGDQEYHLLQQVKVENTVHINRAVFAQNPFQEYIDVVANELEEKYQVDPYTTSLKVYTNMDRDAQQYAHDLSMGEAITIPDMELNYGFMVSETQTGKVVALSGGRQYRDGGASLFNNATQNIQQPGSAFKPVIDYAPAIEFLRWGDRTPISNARYFWPVNAEDPNTARTNQELFNVDMQSGGVLTMDRALGISRNLTAARAMEAVVNKIGFNGLKDFLNKQGFNFDELHMSYSIGGLSTGVTPKQMNGAYAAYGNGGYYIEPYTVASFTDINDENRVEANAEKTRVMEEGTAFMMSTSLELSTRTPGAYVAPANYHATPYAGKTGTSNWDETGAQWGIPNISPRDTWFSGYTTEYTMTSWGGYDPEFIHQGKFPSFANGTHDFSARLWGAMMNHMVTGNEQSYLTMTPPEGVVRRTFDPTTAVNAENQIRLPFGTGQTGFFWVDNLPSGYGENIDHDDLEITLTASRGRVDATFVRRPETYIAVVMVNGQRHETDGESLRVNVSDRDEIVAFYERDGRRIGTITKCYYNGRLYNECPAPQPVAPPPTETPDGNEGEDNSTPGTTEPPATTDPETPDTGDNHE